MDRLAASEVRKEFAEALNREAYQGERIILHRRGKDVAVIISVKDFRFLEEMEELLDVEEAKKRLSDPSEEPIPYERARKDLI